MLWLYILLGVLGFILLLCFSTTLACYLACFYHSNKAKKPDDVTPIKGPKVEKFDTSSVINAALAIPCEKVYIKSHDGLKLYGRYYKGEEGKPISLQFNGYKGNGIRDMAGGLAFSLELGYSVMCVDQRAHGYSEGNTISFGIKERYDVLDWVKYILERFGNNTKIVLQGISMGAATVLMASDLDLPENVVAIIADCPYASPFEIVAKVTQFDLKLPWKIIKPFMLLGARIFGHFNLKESSALESVKKAKVPILIIHGDDDDFVPLEMSERVQKQNPELVTLVPVPGAPHGLSFVVDNALYRKSVIDFYNKNSI